MARGVDTSLQTSASAPYSPTYLRANLHHLFQMVQQLNKLIKNRCSFLYRIELGSSIHDEHINVFHKSSHEGLWQFWKNDSNKISNWNELFNYDPFFGTLPPGFEVQ